MNKAGCVPKKILGNVVCIILMLFIAVLIFPRVFHMKPMQVLTGSMEPTYPKDSLVYVQPVAFDAIHVGDVITFHKNNNLVVTHRVIEIDESAHTFQTKGDANEDADSGVVSYQDVVGKVRWYIPKVGKICSVLPHIMNISQTHAQLSDTTAMCINRFHCAAVNIAVVLEDDMQNYEDKGSQEDTVYTRYGNRKNVAFAQTALTEDGYGTCNVRILNKNLAEYLTEDTYVRVRLLPMLVYDDTLDYQENGIAGTIVAADLRGKLQYTYTEGANWEQRSIDVGGTEEIYSYYTKPLSPGEITEPLIESITYREDIPEGMHLEVAVLAEGIAASKYTPE